MTSPRGITAARPPFFILRFEARPLGFIDMSDLKRLRCLLEPCFEFFHFSENNCRTKCFGKTLWAYAFNFFIFPKTAAGPGASEKPCGRLGRLLGALGRVLSPLDRLLGPLEALLSPLPPPPALEENACPPPKSPQNSPQLHLNFTTQNHLNITPFLTLRGPHFDPPWATQIDPRSAQVAS